MLFTKWLRKHTKEPNQVIEKKEEYKDAFNEEWTLFKLQDRIKKYYLEVE